MRKKFILSLFVLSFLVASSAFAASTVDADAWQNLNPTDRTDSSVSVHGKIDTSVYNSYSQLAVAFDTVSVSDVDCELSTNCYTLYSNTTSDTDGNATDEFITASLSGFSNGDVVYIRYFAEDPSGSNNYFFSQEYAVTIYPSFNEEVSVTLITDMVGTVTNVLGGTLPTIFGLIALLIGGLWVYRFIKRQVGRAK